MPQKEDLFKAQRFLIIQTAYIGDVVLATSIVEKLSSIKPNLHLDILVRKGNETLLENNPHLHSILTWNKKQHKIKTRSLNSTPERSKPETHFFQLDLTGEDSDTADATNNKI